MSFNLPDHCGDLGPLFTSVHVFDHGGQGSCKTEHVSLCSTVPLLQVSKLNVSSTRSVLLSVKSAAPARCQSVTRGQFWAPQPHTLNRLCTEPRTSLPHPRRHIRTMAKVESDSEMKTNGRLKHSQLLSFAAQAGTGKPYFSLTFSLRDICERHSCSNCHKDILIAETVWQKQSLTGEMQKFKC